jgi:hypothetical protein
MFKGATVFNKSLVDWCVILLASEPSEFAISSALSTANKPHW